MSRSPHTGTYKGKRVKVILRDGTRIIDKFLRRTDRFIFLEKTGRIPKGALRSFVIFKPQPHERGQ
jgi:hypothetical protein